MLILVETVDWTGWVLGIVSQRNQLSQQCQLYLSVCRDISDRLADVTFKTGADVAEQKGCVCVPCVAFVCMV